MKREEIDKVVKLEREAEVSRFASEAIIAVDKVLSRLNRRIKELQKAKDEVYRSAEEEDVDTLRGISMSYRDNDRC